MARQEEEGKEDETKRRKLRSRRFVGEENVYREETSELLRMHGCANKRRHFAANK